MNYSLGVDTSNYTTSLAALLESGEVLSFRRMLETPQGEKGLRQSEAHFQHTQNLPALSRELCEALPEHARLCSVGVSTRPRPVEGSYMPCFLAGVSAASLCAAAEGLPLFETSHQEGHLAAALSAVEDFPDTDRFYAMHLSGGTMELLEVQRRKAGFSIHLTAKTLDITAGMLLDRCGVRLGLPFPCGAALDVLALEGGAAERFRVPVREGGVNLSGFENRIAALIDGGAEQKAVAHFALSVAACGIEALLGFCEEKLPVLLCGGVSASAFLRRHFVQRSKEVFFTKPCLATDNAVGVALLAREGRI